ncbi:sequence orphan Slt1 [Datura stramonium]|uniref:Sequence orphan Slt1 n=1 Tax=Datura stramonium TaxID=4076 RepID=A0ABS8T053_DATST|nr:sequence orphan Slt1 [Datura stramonium]
MGEDLITSLSIENYQLSTFLSMDSTATSHEDLDRDVNRQIVLSRPPDINLPLCVERSPPPQSWNRDMFDMLEVGLGHQINECDELLDLPKVGRKCAKRLDSVWGAWFFFTFYFKPVLKEKSKCKIVQDSNGVSGFDKSDLQLDVFLVQHDMENMYMWVFKERSENALGKMQLRSYMNGHSKQVEHPFPFTLDKGFMRSHKMQRKHYRGLSNPQCLHGIELVPSPNLSCIDEEEQKKWMELTGRDLNFSIPPEARDFSSWRNLPNTDFELQRPIPLPKSNSHLPSKQLLNATSLNLSTQPSNHVNSNGLELSSDCGKKRKDLFSHGSGEDFSLLTNPSLNRHQDGEPHTIEPKPWMNEFSGVMKNVYGPVAAAKTIYEDSEGYMIMITLPFVDREKVKVHWWNNIDHGIIKITYVSTAGTPFMLRNGRTFKLTDPSPEHCPPGEFTREISLPTRIPDEAKLEAYFDKSGAVLELKVPKYGKTLEVHEVPVCLQPPNEFVLS